MSLDLNKFCQYCEDEYNNIKEKVTSVETIKESLLRMDKKGKWLPDTPENTETTIETMYNRVIPLAFFEHLHKLCQQSQS